MSADLTERVRLAIRRGLKACSGSELWLDEELSAADAVLAELGPELAKQCGWPTCDCALTPENCAAPQPQPQPQPQAEPVAFTVPRDIRLGETIYTPPGEGVRFCYTRGQPDNVNAWRLGESCRRAADSPAGDYIDRGLSLLKELEARGYGVFRFVKDATPQPQPQPSPQASADADDLALMDEALNAAGYAKHGIYGEAWQRIRASLGVVK